jgi:hypothetical protein
MVFESPKLYDERYIDPVGPEVTSAIVTVHVDDDRNDSCYLIFGNVPSPSDPEQPLSVIFAAPHGTGFDYINNVFGVEAQVLNSFNGIIPYLRHLDGRPKI